MHFTLCPKKESLRLGWKKKQVNNRQSLILKIPKTVDADKNYKPKKYDWQGFARETKTVITKAKTETLAPETDTRPRP